MREKALGTITVLYCHMSDMGWEKGNIWSNEKVQI